MAAQLSYEAFLEVMGPQLVGMGLPEKLWRCAFDKLSSENLDASDAFTLVERDDRQRGESKWQVVSCRPIEKESGVWLCDHCWSFRLKEGKRQLKENEKLRARLQSLFGVSSDTAVDDLWRELLPALQHYQVASSSRLDEEAVWYLMDEFGSSFDVEITRVDDEMDQKDEVPEADGLANFRMAPFFHTQRGVAYTLIWPVKDTEHYEPCSRLAVPKSGGPEDLLLDFPCVRVPQYTEASPIPAVLQCSRLFALMFPWRSSAARELVVPWYVRMAAELLQDEKTHMVVDEQQPSAVGSSSSIASVFDFPPHRSAQIECDRRELRRRVDLIDRTQVSETLKKSPLRVFTDLPILQETLSRDDFTFTDDILQADVLYVSYVLNDGRDKPTDEKGSEWSSSIRFNSHQLVNQLVGEGHMTTKDGLAKMTRRFAWLPDAYDLSTELPQMIGAYHRRHQSAQGPSAPPESPHQGRHSDYWIVKPRNLARSIDTHITNDIDEIVRLSSTFPKVCQRYIDRPACIDGKKFDLRFYVAVKCFPSIASGKAIEMGWAGRWPHTHTRVLHVVGGVQVAVYERFAARMANEPFRMDDFDSFPVHFTVMNYQDEQTRSKNVVMTCTHFKTQLANEHGHHDDAAVAAFWKAIIDKVHLMVRELFQTFVQQMTLKENSSSGESVLTNPTSFAVYGLDVMLEHTEGNLEPRLLEVTFFPDTARLVKEDRGFWDTVFGWVFREERGGAMVEVTM
ncbi:unnamed protein product [Vitrella brassicaformis CCMP3155]|uniref:Tubulin--tyrosine ligase-like protein 12 SET-like domain-containing protein n=2 Tax=Vitrella brassicaformis TaxID=1169539 RepID=A0A0G4EL97_VITBC|nr:unnamed protein product [Vitrella brassicaformis CCMP3155]|mmetsp:Transcript_14024/g.40327  ORF Transcript_14024/g.40327 Transcript_14024/m.40327 type:complete len:737 (-) Transcript_14024:195-2405(-)|eukprot:CEL98187.1 unnamed protein product [Vitrella brassicaformis CCMP3155]